ncbi:hypothetical protein ACQPW1_20090 [Nocardia sp. CA-128927]|uniref:hypothetical protein n=1 Tax=Nocardia sp. CA-128927 TaxID=3239975 RepID=UPI003D953810
MQASQDPVSTELAAADAVAMREQMAELVSGKSGAAMVFGEPITADGITVVPVARAGIGFGGADGVLGGGIDARPLGYIEISHGVARYRPIRDAWGQVLVPLTALAAGLAAPRLIRAVINLRRR